MKKFFTLFTLLLSALYVQAGHIAGGELYYKFLGVGASANTFKYEVTLRLFRECNPPPGPNGTQIAAMPGNVILGIYQMGSTTLAQQLDVSRTDLQSITLSKPSPCIVNAPQVCYQVGSYTTTLDLIASSAGYTIAFQTCCRTNGIRNISGSSVGATYTAEIPPTIGANAINNSSAVFSLKDTTLVCKDIDFNLDFGATDPDNDSLVYSFCGAYDGGTATDAALRPPSSPPYNTIGYVNGSGSQPLGPGVSIDSKTGLISGTAPGAGSYVINVCVSEYRLENL